MNSVSINGLTKRYGKRVAVDSLTLDIKEGELYALLGVNGAGKTTTVRMLSGITKPNGGTATLGGFDIHSPQAREIMALSPQETAIAPALTARENLMLMARLYGLDKASALERVEEIIKKFKLQDIEGRHAKVLSGGFKRRLSIAMAMISEPKILFLDEPTLGLDVIAREELWDIIREMKGEITVILTTHYMEEAEALSDRVGVMKDGVLLFSGTPDELKNMAGAEKFEEAFIKIVKGNGV